MYRIQKAVIKAKGKSQSNMRRSPSDSSDSPLEGIEYTTTKVVPTHPDQLERERIIASFANNANSQTFKTLR